MTTNRSLVPVVVGSLIRGTPRFLPSSTPKESGPRSGPFLIHYSSGSLDAAARLLPPPPPLIRINRHHPYPKLLYTTTISLFFFILFFFRAFSRRALSREIVRESLDLLFAFSLLDPMFFLSFFLFLS